MYLGTLCVFVLGLRCIYCLWVVYIRGRHFVLCFMFYVSFIVSYFTYDTLIIDLYYEVIHGIYLILCFVKSRIYLFLLVFSTHAFMCLLSVSRIYRLIKSYCCLHWQLIDRSYVELFLGILYLNGLFVTLSISFFVMCFVTDCQMGSLLGSKTLGTKCTRTSLCIMLANHDQNIESRFRLTQNVFICKSCKPRSIEPRVD